MPFVLLHHKAVTHKVIIHYVTVISYIQVIQVKLYVYLDNETPVKSNQFQF